MAKIMIGVDKKKCCTKKKKKLEKKNHVRITEEKV